MPSRFRTLIGFKRQKQLRSINVTPVADDVNDQSLFRLDDLVDDAVVANAELIQSGERAGKSFAVYRIRIIGQPLDALKNAPGHRSIQLF